MYEYAQREVTDLRRMDQLLHPELAESRRREQKVRELAKKYTETDQAKRYYMEHLRDALKEGDEKWAVSIIGVLLTEFEGMTPRRIRQSMESRSPLSGVSRRETVQLQEEVPERKKPLLDRQIEDDRELIKLLGNIIRDYFIK